MSGEGLLMVVQGSLLLVLGAVTVAALRFLQRLELHAPPIGARRVQLTLSHGDAFPAHLLPPEVAPQVRSGTAFLLYSGPTCCVCKPVIRSLPHLARDYEDVTFILLTNEAWNPFPRRQRTRVRVVQSKPLVRELHLTVQPYAVKVVDGRVLDFGVVNSAEHVESLLESEGSLQPQFEFSAEGKS